MELRKHDQRISFLHLPPEIRNEIYTFLLVMPLDNTIAHVDRYSDKIRVEDASGQVIYNRLNTLLPFNKVNAHLHAESTALFYGLKTWKFHDISDLTIFRHRFRLAYQTITRIHLTHSPHGIPKHRSINTMSKTLTKMGKDFTLIFTNGTVESLTLIVSEPSWRHWWRLNAHVLTVPFSAGAIPGIGELSRSNSLRCLTILGECDGVKLALRSVSSCEGGRWDGGRYRGQTVKDTRGRRGVGRARVE